MTLIQLRGGSGYSGSALTLHRDHGWDGAPNSNHAPARPQMQLGRAQWKIQSEALETDTGGRTYEGLTRTHPRRMERALVQQTILDDGWHAKMDDSSMVADCLSLLESLAVEFQRAAVFGRRAHKLIVGAVWKPGIDFEGDFSEAHSTAAAICGKTCRHLPLRFLVCRGRRLSRTIASGGQMNQNASVRANRGMTAALRPGVVDESGCERASADAYSGMRHRPPTARSPTRIVNAKSLPGTLACLAWTRSEGRVVGVSSCHVLFGAGAQKGDPVWLLDEPNGVRRYELAGHALFGRMHSIRYGGESFHVDCAIASWVGSLEPPQEAGARRGSASPPPIALPGAVHRGELVSKTGAATGTTTGVIVDAEFCSIAQIDGRVLKTPRQLLIRSLDDGPFSRAGDSGALVINSRNEAVGLLWGATPPGEGVACHLAPALYALDLVFPEIRA